jgi:hypothetical protein
MRWLACGAVQTSDNMRPDISDFFWIIQYPMDDDDITYVFGIRMRYPFYYPYPKNIQISE